MDTVKTKNAVSSFLTYLGVQSQEDVSNQLIGFLIEADRDERRSVTFDQNCLIFAENDKEVRRLALQSENKRIVHFDGHKIKEINPYAYMEEGYSMKGDDASGKRRFRDSSTSTTYTNNNNNNNNNNNIS
jgi:hypothetical protein